MLTSVMALCSALSGACGSVPTSTTGGQAARLEPAVGPDSIRIEYVCGNEFRVINYDTVSVYVSFDVAESADSAQHERIPRRTVGLPPVTMNFTTSSKGTMRLFDKKRLIGTMANGGKPCPPTLLTLLDSMMPESWRTLSDDQKGAAMLTMAAVMNGIMNDPVVKFGKLGPLQGPARVLNDSLVAAQEAMVDSASANLAYDRVGCLHDRAIPTFGLDSVSRISRQAAVTVHARHTEAELRAGRKGIAMAHPIGDDVFCRRVDSLWYARAAKMKKARR